jgi:choice-of-anchor B domain-containing protein
MKLRLLVATALLFMQFSSYSQTPCESGYAGIYPCNNVDLLAHVPGSFFGAGVESNDIWGWTDPLDNKEYVILGLTNGTAFFDISDPLNPFYLGHLPTQTSNSLWRDMKVYNNYAFIVSEAGGHGMQVFDLTRLRSVAAPPETFTVDAHYAGFGNAHNIAINEASGTAYAVGTNTFSGGLHIVDITNPLVPVVAGDYANDGYTHDCQVVIYNGPDAAYVGREIAFNSNEDAVTIADVTDPTDAQTISVTGYANSQYTHQGWLTEDHKYFLQNDELDELNVGNNTRTLIWDVQDLNAPVLIGDYISSIAAIDHNLYNRGNLTFQSNYRGGLRILDHQNVASAVLSEVAFFDCYPSSNAAAFNGTWSNYPYFPSGVVAVSHIEDGLFLLMPQFVNTSVPNDLVCFTDDIVIDVSVEEGFLGNVSLALVSGLPGGATAVFSANNVTAPSLLTLTISNLPAVSASYDFVVEGVGTHFTYQSTTSVSTYDCINDVLGCTDSLASNYNSAATIDDGSCIYPCTDVTFQIDTDCWGGEVSWELIEDATGTTVASVSGGTYGNQQSFFWNGCLVSGCYTFNIYDSFGDGLEGIPSGCAVNGNYLMTDDAFGTVLFQMAAPNYGSGTSHNFCVPLTALGCTDSGACNFDSGATLDDGSCQYLDACGVCGGSGTVAGCTDSLACNYNSAADCDDGSCLALDACGVCGGGGTVAGCTSSLACNYNPSADCDDGSCLSLDACGVCGGSGTVAGCTDSLACNYDSTADCDDSSCTYPDACGVCGGSGTVAGCTDSAACNYNSSADCDDGSCEFASCECIGDFNNDGIRSVPDLLFVLADFGCTSGCASDLNSDDASDTADLLILLSYFGLLCP